MSTIVVLSPAAPPPEATGALPPRLPGLAGRRLGLLDNAKVNANILLREVGRLLAARHTPVDTIMLRKAQAAIPVPAEVAATLSTCAAVVVASAD